MPAVNIIQSLNDAMPPAKMVCSKAGTLLNPHRVAMRSHERKAMVFRYLVYKGLEIAFMGRLTAGQVRGTIDSFPGVESPLEMPNMPLELALREGMELAIAGQAEKSAWFYFAGEPNTLFYRDAKGDITHYHRRSTGETLPLRKSSVSDFIDERIKQQQDFDHAFQTGKAI